jgi:hypothetical protein
MFAVRFRNAVRAAAVFSAAGATALTLAAGAAAAKDPEITVTVTKLKALDRADDLSDGDFFARLTVNGKHAYSAVLTGQKEFTPNWKLTLPAKSGENTVKLELIDKDVSVDDPIDINRLDKKRDLDFTVNTKTGKIEGFAGDYKVGTTITRAGGELKKAIISFKVEVKK